jgi:diaminopimelate decarboxylase
VTTFHYRHGELISEQVALSRVAATVGTPVYVYSAAAIAYAYRRLKAVFRGVPCLICYSVKANSSLAVLRVLARLGAGFDVVSGGELYRVLRAGGDPKAIVFSGVGKTTEEIDFAIRRGILYLNVESRAELETIARRAQLLGRRARVAVRINPDVDPHTHRHISTGKQTHKFGIHWREALPVCLEAARHPALEFVGIGCHIGSQITSLQPFLQALRRLEEVPGQLKHHGIRIRYLDFGGGVGIRYQREPLVPLGAYGRHLKRVVRRWDCQLILEPGRILIGPAGVLLTRVLLEKTTAGRRFVVVDAAMNDFLRPALYGSQHRILSLRRHRPGTATLADVVGPVCETADCFGRGIRLPRLAAGSLLAVMDVGAYGFVLASNYNARVRPTEVMVRGRRFKVIRRRETWGDLIRGEG